jgi:ATP synthase protein I
MLGSQKDDKSKMIRIWAYAGTIPIMMAAGPAVGYLIGSWLDEWLGTGPYLMILFIVLGFVAAGKEIYNMVRKMNKDL